MCISHFHFFVSLGCICQLSTWPGKHAIIVFYPLFHIIIEFKQAVDILRSEILRRTDSVFIYCAGFVCGRHQTKRKSCCNICSGSWAWWAMGDGCWWEHAGQTNFLPLYLITLYDIQQIESRACAYITQSMQTWVGVNGRILKM